MFRNLAATRSQFVRYSSSILKPVRTELAPPPAASYSQAMKVNNLIYVSGQIPLNKENKPVEGDIKVKAEQVISNINEILKASNSSLNHIVKVNIFLTDINNFADFNSVYAKYFNVHKPARSCVAVKSLPLNMDLEVEVIAVEKEN